MLNSVGIELADHIVIGKEGVFSFRIKHILYPPFEAGKAVKYTGKPEVNNK